PAPSPSAYRGPTHPRACAARAASSRGRRAGRSHRAGRCRASRRKAPEAVATLAPGDRDVLLLTAWTDLSYVEIAEALHVPVGTVRSRLNRARSLLRERLGRSGQSPDADHFALEVLADG